MVASTDIGFHMADEDTRTIHSTDLIQVPIALDVVVTVNGVTKSAHLDRQGAQDYRDISDSLEMAAKSALMLAWMELKWPFSWAQGYIPAGTATPEPAPPQSERLLTMHEACALLKVHPNTLRAWHRKGLIQAIRAGSGGTRRFEKRELLATMQRMGYPSIQP